MDALDMRILRELGMEPFVGWGRRPRGLSLSTVAGKLDVGVQLVKDRVARMTQAGVITGYRLQPNLRHAGQDVTVYHLRGATVPDASQMADLADVDGFASVVWLLDSGLCLNLSHASEAERRRRIQLIGRLVGSEERAKVLCTIDFPPVQRRLSNLDWDIVRALQPDAKRRLIDVAEELGVTSKTVRSRLARMREEGSIDEHVALDLSKVEGVFPFQLSLWCDPGMADSLVARFRDRYLAHFLPEGEDRYCDVVLRIFAYTPAEVQHIVREALAIRGVEQAEAMVATGGWENEAWVKEIMPVAVPV